MLKYIQQFVQTFLKEASKSRPRSRKSSRTSVDLTKGNSSMKPEILAIDFSNEGQEAERSKEILELKRTYSLLMKKFINPNLDLMTSSKTGNDMNILNLKGKQELIRSIVKKIFNESIGQQKQLEGSFRDFTEGKVKSTIDEELSLGWSGQRTSKQAAKPMVETASHPNKTAAAVPETPVEPFSSNERQTDKVLKHQLKLNSSKKQSSNSKHFKNLSKSEKSLGLQVKKSDILETGLQCNNSKNQSIDKKQITNKTLNDMALPHLKGSEISRETIKEQSLGNSIMNTNVNDESFKGTDTDTKKKLYPENIVDSFSPSKETTLNEPLESSMNMELNSPSEINKNATSLCSERDNVIKHNQKENINIIRSIAKVDQNRKAKSDNHPIDENENETIKVVKTKNTDQNKVTKIKTNKLQKPIKNLKTSDQKQKTTVGVLKEEEPPSTKHFAEKNEQSPLYPTMPEKSHNLTDTTVNMLSENVEVSNLSGPIRKETNKENTVAPGENVSKSNIEALGKEHNQTCSIKEISKEPPGSVIEKANTNIEESTEEVVNENTKSRDKSYFDYLSNKLHQTSNDAQQFISSLQKSNWETKNVSTSDALNRNFIQSDVVDKQVSLELSNKSSKQDIQNIANNASFKTNSSFEQNTKNFGNQKTLNPQKVNALEPQTKTSYSQTNKSKSTDTWSARGANNSTKNFDGNLKNNNMITKSCNNPYISNMHRSNYGKSKSNTTPRNTNNNTAYREKEFKNVYSKVKFNSKITNKASALLRDQEDSKIELSPKEVNDIDNSKNISPEAESKIKKLLRRFNKIQKSKSKTNIGSVQRIYSKFVNDGKLKKMSSHKLKVNKDKNLIHKIRRVMKIKSDPLSMIRTSSPNDTIKGKTHSNSFPVSESKSNTLNSKKSTTTINRQKAPVSSTKVLTESVLGVRVNRLDSDIFPSLNKNIDNDEYRQHTSKENGQLTMQDSSKIKTELDITKPRKLHSKKETCKSSNLQMYGAKRSIYTHSNPKRNLSKNIMKECDHEKIGEPHFSNLAMGSLIKVSKVTANNQINVNLITTQVRNLHTTGFRGKVKQLPRKKRTTITKQSKQNMASTDSATIYSPIDEATVSITKPIEIKLNNEPNTTMDRSLNKMSTYFSSKGEVIKESSLKDLKPHSENQSEITDNNNCSPKDMSNQSLLPRSIENKADNNTGALYSNTTVTPHSSDDIKVKNTEVVLNVDSQYNASPQGNEVAIDSPKWKSKADRLNKWKLEADSNSTEANTKDLDIKTNGSFESYSNEVQHERIITNEHDLTSEKDGEKNELSVDHKTENRSKFSYENIEEKNFQKDKKLDTKYNESGKKIVKIELENKKILKDSGTTLLPLTPRSLLTKNRFEINNVTSTKIGCNEGNDYIKKDASTDKIKEFESKLKILESKLRFLELKSLEKQNSVPLQKTSAPEDSGNVISSPKWNYKIIDKSKTFTFNKEHILPPNYSTITNSESAGTDGSLQNKNRPSTSMKYDNKSGKKEKSDSMKEHLSQKVKRLELKLKDIETKILNLKSKPSDSANNKELCLNKIPSSTRSAEENKKSKPVVITRKSDERTDHPNDGSNIKLGNLNSRDNRTNIGVNNQEINFTKTVVYEKPEVYLKHYLTTTKNNVKKNVQSAKNKSTFNNINHPNNEIVPLTSQMTSRSKEPKLKSNSLTTVDKSSEKVLTQKLLPKSVKLSGIKEVNKDVSHGKNKNDLQKTKNNTNFIIPIKTFNTKTTLTQPSNSAISVSVNKNILGRSLRSASVIDNTNDINVKIPKGRDLSKSSYATVPFKTLIPREAALESKISILKYNNHNEDAKGQNIISSRKMSSKKSPSSNVDKKISSKRNSHQPSSKEMYHHFYSGFHVEEKRNTLHEGLLRSTRLLKSIGPEYDNALMNVIEKIDPDTQIKISAYEKSHKSPVFPKRLSQTLRKLTRSPEKQENSSHTNNKLELEKSIDSTELSKSEQEKCIVNQNVEKNFNSFDYYKPKRRSREVKHPIEKEKCSIKFPRKCENMPVNEYQKILSQNTNPHSEYFIDRVKSGKLPAKFYNESDKKLNTLIFHNHAPSVKLIQK